LKVTVCLDREAAAGGVEARMLELLNDLQNPVGWASLLSSGEGNRVRSALPVHRFRDLLGVPGVSREAYAELFRLLYGKATDACGPEAEPEPPHESVVQLTFSF
jgi:hypothetical protein